MPPCWGFPGGSDSRASACSAGDLGLIPGSGRCPGEGDGNPLQYSCLEYPMDGGAWWATVHGASTSRTRLGDSPGPGGCGFLVAKSCPTATSTVCVAVPLLPHLSDGDNVQPLSQGCCESSVRCHIYTCHTLVVQRLRLCTAKPGGPGSIPGQGMKSHISQLMIPHAAN